MATGVEDPAWPKVLSLAVHEFRTPITVVAGYIRMLLKDRAGPVNDQQRRLLEEAEKSCGRLSSLVAEMSELSHLEDAPAGSSRSAGDLVELLRTAIAALPELPDRHIQVELLPAKNSLPIEADAKRLTAALASLLGALRREVVAGDRLLVRPLDRTLGGRRASWIAIADAERIDELSEADAETLSAFDELRGGCGLSLTIARRIIAAHDGRVWSPPDRARSAAVVMLPARNP
jgi:signal transduction histidine kinase